MMLWIPDATRLISLDALTMLWRQFPIPHYSLVHCHSISPAAWYVLLDAAARVAMLQQ